MHMRRLSVLLSLLIMIAFLLTPFSYATLPNGGVQEQLSMNASLPQGVTVDPNGTVVVSGNVTLSGGVVSAIYAGHGAFFVSGNFIIQKGTVLHVSNLSIVFVQNASFINHGRAYFNNSIVTVYNLSINGIPSVTFLNYGYLLGNDTSLEFPGFLYSSSSTLILNGGYFGKAALSFSTTIVGSTMVLSKERVYGAQMLGKEDSLGYQDLVSMNISRSTVYTYNTFFNLVPPKPVKAMGNKTNNSSASYSSTTGKYSGGYINLASSSIYLLNFSMNFSPSAYGNDGYIFPFFGDAVSSAYFFDSASISITSQSGYPVFNLPYSMDASYSSYATIMNSGFRNVSYTQQYSPFPRVIGPLSDVFGLVDVYNETGLFTFNYYNLSIMGRNYTIQYPALPLFEGDPASITVTVPTVYFQLSGLNLTYSQNSTVLLNYSVLYGSVNGDVDVTLNNSVVYSTHLSAIAGSAGVLYFRVRPLTAPGSYYMNVDMNENSYYSYNLLSVPVVVHQDLSLNLSIVPVYHVRGMAPDFVTSGNVTIYVNSTGIFLPSYGELFLEMYNGSGYYNYSDYFSLVSGRVVTFTFPIPSDILLAHTIVYRLTVYPAMFYTFKSNYSKILNQSLQGILTRVNYHVVPAGVGSASLDLNFSVESLTAESNYSVYVNGISKASGYAAPGWTNLSIPIAVGKNFDVLELNGQKYGEGNASTAWNLTFYFYNVAFNASIAPYMTSGYPPLIHLNISAVGTSSLSMLSVYLNGTLIPLNGSSISFHAASQVNNLTVYENVLGVEVPVVQRVLTSEVVYPPPLKPSDAVSLVGVYHTSVSFTVPINSSITSVVMVGSGASYRNSTVNGIETFFFYSNFASGGIHDEGFVVNGTVHGLPFSVDLSIPVSVGYPSLSIDYLGQHIVEYGTKNVELKEINLNHTGTFSILTITVYSAGSSRTYVLDPNSQGVVTVPLPSGLGVYSVSITYNSGFSHETIVMKNVVTVSLFALPLWLIVAIIVAIGSIAGLFASRKLAVLMAPKKTNRMVRCDNCKREVVFDADKCPYCGVKFSDRMMCEECGAEIPRDSDYCPVCGLVFNKDLKLGQWLKKKYRTYIEEKKKDLEKVIGRLEYPEFWRMVIQGGGSADIEQFEAFRQRYITSGSVLRSGLMVCPICGTGMMPTDPECPECHIRMDLVTGWYTKEAELKGVTGTKRRKS